MMSGPWPPSGVWRSSSRESCAAWFFTTVRGTVIVVQGKRRPAVLIVARQPVQPLQHVQKHQPVRHARADLPGIVEIVTAPVRIGECVSFTARWTASSTSFLSVNS